MLKYGEVNFNTCATSCVVFFFVVDQVRSHVNVFCFVFYFQNVP